MCLMRRWLTWTLPVTWTLSPKYEAGIDRRGNEGHTKKYYVWTWFGWKISRTNSVSPKPYHRPYVDRQTHTQLVPTPFHGLQTYNDPPLSLWIHPLNCKLLGHKFWARPAIKSSREGCGQGWITKGVLFQMSCMDQYWDLIHLIWSVSISVIACICISVYNYKIFCTCYHLSLRFAHNLILSQQHSFRN